MDITFQSPFISGESSVYGKSFNLAEVPVGPTLALCCPHALRPYSPNHSIVHCILCQFDIPSEGCLLAIVIMYLFKRVIMAVSACNFEYDASFAQFSLSSGRILQLHRDE